MTRGSMRTALATLLASAVLVASAAPAAADPVLVPPKSKKEPVAYYLRFTVDVLVVDDDDFAGADKTSVVFPSDIAVREGELFVLGLVSACAGDEVRFESEIRGRIDRGFLKASFQSSLFEGTTCETTDLATRSLVSDTVEVAAAVGDTPFITAIVGPPDVEDFGGLKITLHEARVISWAASYVPTVEMIGRLDVTDHEDVIENERGWAKFWARAATNRPATITTCAGDEVRVAATVSADPSAPPSATVRRELELREGTHCEGEPVRGTASRLDTITMGPTFQTKVDEIHSSDNHDDMGVLKGRYRLVEFAGGRTGGGVLDLAELDALIAG
jgi:hypothetical protein